MELKHIRRLADQGSGAGEGAGQEDRRRDGAVQSDIETDEDYIGRKKTDVNTSIPVFRNRWSGYRCRNGRNKNCRAMRMGRLSN